MPRQIVSDAKNIITKAYAPEKKPPSVTTQVMRRELTKPDPQQVNRQRFGRSLSLDRIETGLRNAFKGSMQQITDISRETVDTDPHLGAVLQKRFGAVSSLPFEIRPATGFGTDKEKAFFYAAVVREQLENLSSFRRVLNQIAWALFDGRMAEEFKWTPRIGAIQDKEFAPVTWILSDIDWIHPRRLSFGPERNLVITDENGMQSGNFNAQGISLTEEDLKEEHLWRKFMWWMPQMFGDYAEREGLAQRCVIWSFFKRFAARERMILLELFGKPWRIAEVDEKSPASGVSDEDLTAIKDIIDGLGNAFTAMIPRGIKVNVIQPGETAGRVHEDIIAGVDEQISKLVLGQTGTTDGVPDGLNSSQSRVMQDEQFMILQRDAMAISEIVENMITDAIIEVNFGHEELPNAPKFVLRFDLPADRKVELERLKLTLDAGLPVIREQAYEVSGFTIPEDGDVIIKVVQPPQDPLSQVAPAPRPEMVYPEGTSPPVGEQQPKIPTASTGEGSKDSPFGQIGSKELNKTVTVNESRMAQDLPPLTMPDGTPDPDGDLTVAEFEEKRVKQKQTPETTEDQSATEESEDEIVTEEVQATLALQPSDVHDPEEKIQLVIKKEGNRWVIWNKDRTKELGSFVVRQDGDEYVVENKSGKSFGRFKSRSEANKEAEKQAKKRLREIEFFKRAKATLSQYINDDDIINRLILSVGAVSNYDTERCHICCTQDLKQPETVFGSPDQIYTRGIKELLRETKKWSEDYQAAIPVTENVTEIFNALNRASEDIDVNKYARALERRMLQSLALGSLDNAHEIGDISDEEVKATAEDPNKVLAANFAESPFAKAIKFFLDKLVITKSIWNAVSADIKRLTFTIAGVQNQQMLEVLHAELAKQVAEGGDLRKFKKIMIDRLKSAGMILSQPEKGVFSAPHVENVFRTNLMNSYNSGRITHARQPNVLRRFPVWEISVVRDARTRSTHRRVHGVKLLATDDFWRMAYPPFGFNCRCRVKSRSSKHISGVVSGSTIRGLPDPGFVSGIPVSIISQ